MDPMEAENLLRKLDRRVENIEQILPTLPTREEMRAEIREAVEPLATKAELAAESERTRRHFDVIAESLRDDIRLVAASQVALQAEVRQGRKQLDHILSNHERRITRLEASDTRARGRKRR